VEHRVERGKINLPVRQMQYPARAAATAAGFLLGVGFDSAADGGHVSALAQLAINPCVNFE
jgi:hypothetical protein